MSVHVRDFADVVDYRATQLVIDGALELDEYENLLATLGRITRGHQWWVGDALVYGENRYGEDTFSQAADALDLEPHTLVNYRYVASAVEPSRRREDLTWSHHAEVARLTAGDQRRALAAAVKNGWNVRQLRDHVAITWPAKAQLELTDDTGRLGDQEEITVNRRLEEIATRLDAGGYDLDAALGDLRWLHAIARRLVRGGR